MFDKIKPFLVTLVIVFIGIAVVHRVAPLKKLVTGNA